ncbi:hypothetical protein ACLOJK_010173 [Asimina triloba]
MLGFFYSLSPHLDIGANCTGKYADVVGGGECTLDTRHWPLIDPLPSYGRGRERPGGRHMSFIHGNGLEDVIITGDKGTIDGQGYVWWDMWRRRYLRYTRPSLIELMYSKDILISNVVLLNSPFWNIHPVYCSNVVIKYVTILAPFDSPNTDGIDPDSSYNVCIEDCYIATGDDLVALKSGWDEYGIRYDRPSYGITIRRLRGTTPFAGIAIGSETSGGIENVLVQDVSIFNSGVGIHLKTNIGRGGTIKNITVTDVFMENVSKGIRIAGDVGDHPDRGFNPDALPVVDMVTLRDVWGVNVRQAGSIQGLSKSPFTRICLWNVHFSGVNPGTPWTCSDVRGAAVEVSPWACRELSSSRVKRSNGQHGIRVIVDPPPVGPTTRSCNCIGADIFSSVSSFAKPDSSNGRHQFSNEIPSSYASATQKRSIPCSQQNNQIQTKPPLFLVSTSRAENWKIPSYPCSPPCSFHVRRNGKREMLTRAFHGRKKSPRARDDGGGSLGGSQQMDEEEEEALFGHLSDLPLTFCGGAQHFRALGLKEVLQSSVQVLGESGLGISEKVVLWDGAVFASKRFRKVSVGRTEFRRRMERLARISADCQHLVPLRAYVYAKRIKVVLCSYYPMGSLADLLSGARELGHTHLAWPTRLQIILHVARAIAFIHSQPPPQHDKHLQLNVHGNIKASNVFVKIDFSACLSNYGFHHLGERPKVQEITDLAGKMLTRCDLTQKCDILSFGKMVLDILGGPTAPFQKNYISERKEDIREGKISFFEFPAEGEAKSQAFKVLDIALACTHASPETRPTIEQILDNLREMARGADEPHPSDSHERRRPKVNPKSQLLAFNLPDEAFHSIEIGYESISIFQSNWNHLGIYLPVQQQTGGYASIGYPDHLCI